MRHGAQVCGKEPDQMILNENQNKFSKVSKVGRKGGKIWMQ